MPLRVYPHQGEVSSSSSVLWLCAVFNACAIKTTARVRIQQLEIPNNYNNTIIILFVPQCTKLNININRLNSYEFRVERCAFDTINNKHSNFAYLW